MQWTSVMHLLDSRKGSCASCLMKLETVKFTDGPLTAERGRASAVTAELHDVTYGDDPVPRRPEENALVPMDSSCAKADMCAHLLA